MASKKRLKKFSDLRLIQHLLLRIWHIHDSGGVSNGRSLENRFLEAARKLFPHRIRRTNSFTGEELLHEAWLRSHISFKRKDRRWVKKLARLTGGNL